MKKRLCTSAGAVFACITLFAQGTVNLANTGGSAVTNLLTGAWVAAGTNFNVALYHLPDAVYPPATADFDLTGTPLAPWADFYSPGYFDGGIRTTPYTTPPGGFGWFQVRAWETAFGTSFEQAIAAPAISGRRALVGTSNIIRVRTGLGANDPGSLVNSGLQGFTLLPIPEDIVISDFSIDAVITFNTTTGHVYAVDRTGSLSPVNWQPVPGATNVAGTGGSVSVTDRNANCVDQRYYRVRLVQ